jgi:uncharacterized protein
MLPHSRPSLGPLVVPVRSDQRAKGAWRQWLAGVSALVGVFVFIVSTRAAMYEWSTAHRPPLELRLRAADTAIAGLREVTFDSEPGVTIRSWFSEPRNGALVILAHGSDSNRLQLLPEARILDEAGFGILAFDWPGNGQSGGHVEWGRAERLALGAAVTFVERNAAVQRGAIGAFGFSIGALYLTQAAAADPRLSAIALAAAPDDLTELRRWEHRRWSIVSEQSGLLAARVLYGSEDPLSPVRLIHRLSPRPLLFIDGGLDECVPHFMSERLYAAAGEPKRRLSIAGAGHGDFVRVAPHEYAHALQSFFREALLDERLASARRH